MSADRTGRRLAEHAREEARIGLLQVAARAVAVLRQQFVRAPSHAPQDAHGLRGEPGTDRVRPERRHEEAVRLRLLAPDLREEAVRRDADRAGEAAGRAHLGAEAFAERAGVAEEMDRTRDVEKRLVHRHPLDERRVVAEDFEHLGRHLLVDAHARLHEDAVRTLLVRRAARHGGTHPEHPRLVAARGDDAPLVRTRPHDDGQAAPGGVVALFDGREERIHVDVQNGPRRHLPRRPLTVVPRPPPERPAAGRASSSPGRRRRRRRRPSSAAPRSTTPPRLRGG